MKWINITNRINIYNQWSDLNTNYYGFSIFKIELQSFCSNYRKLNISLFGFELQIKLTK